MNFKQETPYYCGPACLVVVQADCGWTGLLNQEAWANIAGTTTKGTSIAGLKRGLKHLSCNFEIVRKTLNPWRGTAIFYDAKRDHWMVASVVNDGAFGSNAYVGKYNPKLYRVYVADPEDGQVHIYYWYEFQKLYMNSAKNSYALVIS